MAYALERIHAMLDDAGNPNCPFPATTLYCEGWLLRLVLDWFARQPCDGAHALSFHAGARWFSEGLLQSQFRPRPRRDSGRGADLLAEGPTHADGIIGHVEICGANLAEASLRADARQLLITEAKLYSPLSPGTRNAKDFDQAARNVACIAEILCSAKRRPDDMGSLAFFVITPEEQKAEFTVNLSKESVLAKVKRRVDSYACDGTDSQSYEAKKRWMVDWFVPMLDRMQIDCLTWEDILGHVGQRDAPFHAALSEFYGRCKEFNRPRERGNPNPRFHSRPRVIA